MLITTIPIPVLPFDHLGRGLYEDCIRIGARQCGTSQQRDWRGIPLTSQRQGDSCQTVLNVWTRCVPDRRRRNCLKADTKDGPPNSKSVGLSQFGDNEIRLLMPLAASLHWRALDQFAHEELENEGFYASHYTVWLRYDCTALPNFWLLAIQ